jgi:hypothetical protein
MTQRIEFSSPVRKARQARPITVDLYGKHEIVLQRPKDAVLFFASVAGADNASSGDRAAAIIQFVNGATEPVQQQKFWQLAIRGELNLQATVDLITAATTRWQHWDAKNTAPIRITWTPSAAEYEPVEVVNEDLDLHLVCTPPTDLILTCVAASMASSASEADQAWGIGMFLDAALSPADGMVVSQRLRSLNGDLELEDVGEIVTRLIDVWKPTSNRDGRRAAQKKPAASTARRQSAGRGTVRRTPAKRAR